MGDGMFGNDGRVAQHPIVDRTDAREGCGGEWGMRVVPGYDAPSPSSLASPLLYN